VGREIPVDVLKTDLPSGEAPSTHFYRVLSIICALMAALIGTLGLVGLFLGIPVLTSVLPGLKGIAFSASLFWILLGLILAGIVYRLPERMTRYMIAFIIFLVVVLSTIELPINITGGHFVVETFLVKAGNAIFPLTSTPISPLAVLLTLISALAIFLLLLFSRVPKYARTIRNVACTLGIVITLFSFTILLSYFYGNPFLYGTVLIPIALTSALAAFFLGTGIVLAAGPDAYPLSFVTGSSIRARLLRIFLPLVIAILFVQNYLERAIFVSTGWEDTIFVSSLLVLAAIVSAYLVGKASKVFSRNLEYEQQQRNAAEVGLAAARKQYQELFDNVNIGLLRTTPGPNGKIIEANPATIRIYEADSREQLLAVNPNDLYFDPDQRRKISDEVVEKGLITGMDVRYKTLKGRPIWCRVTATRKISENGEVFFDNTIDDITERRRVGEALVESERRYRNLYQYAQVGLFETSLKDATVVACNRRYADLAGFESVAAAIGQDIRSLYVNHGERDEVARILRETGQIDDRTVKLRNKKTGRIFWSQFSARLNYDRDVAEGTIIDITAQKEALELLWESEEQYRSTLENMQDAYFRADGAGIITRANPAAAVMYGYPSAEEMVGIPASSLYVSREDRDEVFRHLDKTGRVADYPGQGKRRDGSLFWVSLNVRVTFDAAGKVVFSEGFVRDTTERKRAESLIREINDILNQAQMLAHVGSWQFDLVKNHIVWSDETYRIFGYEPGKFDLTLENIRKAMHPDDIEKHDQIIADAIATGHYQPEEYRLIRPDYSVRIISGDGKTISDTSGKVVHLVGVIQDITERKQAENQREVLIKELEDKNAALERFTYTISHDLKSPLITIRGFAGLIEADVQKNDPVQLQKDIERITTAADTMQELLADLLELSRIGRVVKPPEVIPFGLVVRESVELLAGPLSERGVRVEVAPDLPNVFVDRARIRQVMSNLIENAIKFSGDRPDPIIRIGVDFPEGPPVFFVQDNGIGLESRYLERIFNLFEKLDVSVPGTGIGLTTIRRIIEVHGGRIWAESEGIGKGTTFRFTLPSVPEKRDDDL